MPSPLPLRSARIGLLALFATPALADEDMRLEYQITVKGQPVGTRVVDIHLDESGKEPVTILSARTRIDATIGPVSYRYDQRLTASTEGGPASFQSVINDNGTSWELQARRIGGRWLLAEQTTRGPRMREAAGHEIDLSTADLMNPWSAVPLKDLSDLQLLSAETGDVWQGEVTAVEGKVVKLGKRRVAVQGLQWRSPEGPATFYYDAEGVLVRYEMRLMGLSIQASLTHAPPKGPDTFAVPIGSPTVDELPLTL